MRLRGFVCCFVVGFAYCGLCWLLLFCVFVVFLSSVCCEFGVWLVVLAVDGCLLGG